MVVWTSRIWHLGPSSLFHSVSSFILLSLRSKLCLHQYQLYVAFDGTNDDLFSSPILYSIAGLGIAIVNDFKSIEGDRAMGLQSLPVAFGVDTAKYICAASVTLTQLGVAAYLNFGLNEPLYAGILLALILPQAYFQATLLLPDPIENDVKYQASAQPFLVFGILATALCVGHHDFA